MTTYVLINTLPWARKAVVRRAAGLTGVVSAEPVSGAYDVIVRADDPRGAWAERALVSALLTIPGVQRALPCPVGTAEQMPAAG